jgi:mannose-6-phosphate isomerase-like protein (cupin superfamily)
MAYVGEVIDNPVSGERIVFRQTSATTRGQLLAFELSLAPRGHVPSSHLHPRQEERFTILEGRMRFRRGRRRLVAGPGETVVVPPGATHRFANAGPGRARVRVEVRPALRMEDLLETAADLAREGCSLPNGMPRPLDLALFLEQFQDEVAIPVLPRSVARLGRTPLVWLARRRGLDARYRVERRRAA